MNEYLKTFQSLQKSADYILNNEYNSLEIRQSAINLQTSIEPCLEELKQSAVKMKAFIQKGFTELHYAETTWNSKPKIAEAPKEETWQQIGEISGCAFRLQLLGNQCKNESVKLAQQCWETKIDKLKEKWFIDKKGQLKRGVGWSEKDGFIKDIRSELEGVLPLPEISIIINEGLKKLNRDLSVVNENHCKYSDKVLEIKIENILDEKIYSIQDFIERNSNSNEHRPTVVKGIKELLKPPLATLLKERNGDILWEELALFQSKMSFIIESFIYYIFNEQMNLLNQIFTKILSVYNEFLERQERYQQETPKQREAEKAWIDLQRHQLKQIQMGIEEILQSEGV